MAASELCNSSPRLKTKYSRDKPNCNKRESACLRQAGLQVCMHSVHPTEQGATLLFLVLLHSHTSLFQDQPSFPLLQSLLVFSVPLQTADSIKISFAEYSRIDNAFSIISPSRTNYCNFPSTLRITVFKTQFTKFREKSWTKASLAFHTRCWTLKE